MTGNHHRGINPQTLDMSEVAAQSSDLSIRDADKQPDQAIRNDDDKQPVAPDQFDEKYQTTKWEIWAYYAWVAGCLPRSMAKYSG